MIFRSILGFALGDKSPLFHYKVRHYGDPLAAVVADNEVETKEALSLIDYEYKILKVAGRKIITVEGLKNMLIQQAFMEEGSFQCGY